MFGGENGWGVHKIVSKKKVQNNRGREALPVDLLARVPSRTKAEGAAAARLGMQLAKMLQPTTGQPIRNVARSATTGAMSSAGAGTSTAAVADQNIGIGIAVGAATGGTISPAMDLGRAGL